MVIFGHLSFSFEDLDQYSRLVIGISGESLRFFGGDGGVSGNQSGENSSGGFDT